MAAHDPVWLRKAQQLLTRRGQVAVIAFEGKIDVRSSLDYVRPEHEIVGFYRRGADRRQLVEDVEAYRCELHKPRYRHRVSR